MNPTSRAAFAVALFLSGSAFALPKVTCTLSESQASITIRAGSHPIAEYRRNIGSFEWYSVLKDLQVTSSGDTHTFKASATTAWEAPSSEQYQSFEVNVSMATHRGTGSWELSYKGRHFGANPFYESGFQCVMDESDPTEKVTLESLFVQAACEGKYDEVNAYLGVPTLNADFVGKSGETALTCAARNKHYETVRRILDNAKPYANRSIRSGIDAKTLIHFPLPADIHTRLYSDLSVEDILMRDTEGKTVFHYNYPLANYLGAAGKVPNALLLQKDLSGKTPIDYAKDEWLDWLLENTTDVPLDPKNGLFPDYLIRNGKFDEKRFERLLALRPTEMRTILGCESPTLLKLFVFENNANWMLRYMKTCGITGPESLRKMEGFPDRIHGSYFKYQDLLHSLAVKTTSFCVWTLSEKPELIFDHENDPIRTAYEWMKKYGISDAECDRFYAGLLRQRKFPAELARVFLEKFGDFKEKDVTVIPIEIGVGTRDYYFLSPFTTYVKGVVGGKLHRKSDGTFRLIEYRFYPQESFYTYDAKEKERMGQEFIEDGLLQIIRNFAFQKSTPYPTEYEEPRLWFFSSKYGHKYDEGVIVPGTSYLVRDGSIFDLRMPASLSKVGTIDLNAIPLPSDLQQHAVEDYSWRILTNPEDDFERRLYFTRFAMNDPERSSTERVYGATVAEATWNSAQNRIEFKHTIGLTNRTLGYITGDSLGYNPVYLSMLFSPSPTELIFDLSASGPHVEIAPYTRRQYFSLTLPPAAEKAVFDYSDMAKAKLPFDPTQVFDYIDWERLDSEYGLNPSLADKSRWMKFQEWSGDWATWPTYDGWIVSAVPEHYGDADFRLVLSYKNSRPVFWVRHINFRD